MRVLERDRERCSDIGVARCEPRREAKSRGRQLERTEGRRARESRGRKT